LSVLLFGTVAGKLLPASVYLKNVTDCDRQLSFECGKKFLIKSFKSNVMEETNNYAENDDLIPHLKSLSEVSNKMVLKGYDDDFKIDEAGERLMSIKTEKTFLPEQVKIVNYFRFEGQSDPNDNTILYVIEAEGGIKGTIVDAYGPYADRKLAEFITKIEDIQKKTTK